MQRTDEELRRERRNERFKEIVREVASWSSERLRMAYAQPETVRAAEERERNGTSECPSSEGES